MNKEVKAFGEKIRDDFPIFAAANKRMAYLDTAASAQKPQVVIDKMAQYYAHEYANIHRGAYELSLKITEDYEGAREKVAAFLNAPSPDNIVFTHGATEGLNLIAHTLGERFTPADTVLLSVLEHHSNIVPWQLLSKRKGVKLEFVDVKDDASFDFDDLIKKLDTFKPKLLSITYISNAFGSVFPIADICKEAHKRGCLVLVDAAQAVAHLKIDVQELNPDFLVFSGHKAYGPNGIGVLYGKSELLQELPPFFGGGDMIEKVTLETSTYADPPYRFEAGTPAIVEAIGLGCSLEYLETLGVQAISTYEENLFMQSVDLLKKEDGVILYGPAATGDVKPSQASIISFNLKGVHPFDFATAADYLNVQLRVGHHCAMPAMKRFGISATARISLAVYSDLADIEQLLEAIRYAKKILR